MNGEGDAAVAPGARVRNASERGRAGESNGSFAVMGWQCYSGGVGPMSHGLKGDGSTLWDEELVSKIRWSTSYVEFGWTYHLEDWQSGS